MSEFGKNHEISEVPQKSSENKEVSSGVKELNDDKLEPPAKESPENNKETSETDKPETQNEQKAESQKVENLEKINEEPLKTKETETNKESEKNNEAVTDDVSKSEHAEKLVDENSSEAENASLEKDSKEKSIDNEEKNSAETLRFGKDDFIEYDENKSDVDKARDDWKHARMERDAYKELVKSGEIPKNKEVSKALDDAVKDTKQTFTDVRNGQPYSFEKPSDYWKSKEGKEIAGEIGAVIADKVFSKLIDEMGAKLPKDVEDNVSDICKEIGKYIGEHGGYEVIGKVADGSKSLMENAYDTHTSQEIKDFNSTFIMKDENGNYITAEQGAKLAFGEND